MKKINEFMRQGVADKVFPGAVLLVSNGNSILFHRAYGCTDIYTKERVTKETIFDLASFTKPLATTLGVMKLIENKKLSLDCTIKSILPFFNKTDKENITIKQLLLHRSGLIAHLPFYERLCTEPYHLRKKILFEMICAEPLFCIAEKETVYSDLGFMILGEIIEKITNVRLDCFLDEKIYKPLGLKNLFFPNSTQSDSSQPDSMQFDTSICLPNRKFASTEACPWRKMVLNGVVHDDNAYAIGGIMGHAGLFGTANDVNILLSDLLMSFYGKSMSNLFNRELLQVFFMPNKDAGRTLGFDLPSLTGSSSGKFFSKTSVGHLGFTGTSFWMDLSCSIIVILLTNRVHPDRNNNKIRLFRPLLHDTVMKTLKSCHGG